MLQKHYLEKDRINLSQVIFHIDINAFYASAHAALDPQLRDKPVAVSNNRRGSVITTANYVARSYGVESAMPTAIAKRLCPQLVLIPVDFALYKDLSAKFMNIVRSFSPYLQIASIDECYVDVSKAIQSYEKPLDLAVAIQEKVYETLALPISIGVGPNKFLAKMASDMKKPMGITVLRIREAEEKLWPLPIESMHGIGRKTVPKLKEMGIFTIGDLAQGQFNALRPILGNHTQKFIDRAHGIDTDPLELVSTAKSVGQSKTFKTALYDTEEIHLVMMEEIIEIEKRLKGLNMMGRTVQFSIRFEDFTTANRSLTYEDYFDDRYTIFDRALELYAEFEGIPGVTFISVTMANLLERDAVIEQMNIFDQNKDYSVDEIIQRLNKEMNADVFKKTGVLINE
ncbi:MAG TPA: DNA polymerase IV [Erysipelothrix sp.]